MLLRVLLPLIILAVGGGGAWALIKSRPEAKPIETEERAWLVRTMVAQVESHRPTLTLYGRVETPRTAHLTAALTADVMTVHVREGERVETGQVLVELDRREADLLVRQREAEAAEIRALIDIEGQQQANNREALDRETKVLELARRAVARAEELAQRNVGSRSQLDTARQEEEQRSMTVDARHTAIQGHLSRIAQLEARLAKAEALLDRAKLDVERSQVRAPFSGPVASVSISTGDRVQPGSNLLSVFDSEALELRAQIPTRHVPTVRTALAAGERVTGSATVGGQALKADLMRMGAEVARGSGGVDALFAITDGSENLPLGLTVELAVALPPETGVIALPPQALYGAGHVYRVEGERMARVAVERIGQTRTVAGNFVLVRSRELKAGDAVVATQLPNAVDGLRVEVVAAD